MLMNEALQEQLQGLPEQPGIYKYFNAEDTILYVGKAKNLRKRVKSYFITSRNHPPKVRKLVAQIARIETVITGSEIEAFQLENNLIKHYRPRYNVQLKDGKTYPYIVIRNERFPRVASTRKKIRDGSTYFGPYTSATAMYSLLALFKKNFKLRTCSYLLSEENITKGKFRACLEYHIGNCNAPCIGKESEQTYSRQIAEIKEILNGKYKEVIEQMQVSMLECAGRYAYEEAEIYRTSIERIREFRHKSSVVTNFNQDAVVISVRSLEHLMILHELWIREGAVYRTQAYEAPVQETDETEFLMSAVSRILAEEPVFNQEIITNVNPLPEEIPTTIKVVQPSRGPRKQLLDLAVKNSDLLLEEKVYQQVFRKSDDPARLALEQLQKELQLKRLPVHIECFDNSNLQGQQAVSSIVVFRNGKPSKRDYRYYNVQTVVGPDDFMTMKEAITRRYRSIIEEGKPLPDLVIIDGGKGQLSHVMEALTELELADKLPVISIAKRLEEIYCPGDPHPLYLDKRGPALKLIQQLRDEAHRFGITAHRKRRNKEFIQTRLTMIPGIGKTTAIKLLSAYKSVEGIKMASAEDIARCAGKKTATLIRQAINNGLL